MTSIRKFLLLVLALALTGIALPASAALKYFTVATTDLTFPAPAAGEPYTVTFYDSPGNSGGNSNINSVKIDIPAGLAFQITGWNTFDSGTVVPGGSATFQPSNAPVALNTWYPASTSARQIGITGFTGAKPGGRFEVYLLVAGDSPGCTVLAKGYAFTGQNFGGTSFTAYPSGSDVLPGFTCQLGCPGDSTHPNFAGNLDPTLDCADCAGTPDWGLVRGNNLDGGTCTAVPFQFILDPTTNKASFIAIKGGQQLVAEYIVLWGAGPVDAYPTTYAANANLTAGWTQRRPQVAWGFATTPTDSQYVPALACVNDTLASAAFPLIPDVDPFHNNVYSQYLPNQTAQVCVAQQGFTSVGALSGKTQVQYWTKFIDKDAFTKMP